MTILTKRFAPMPTSRYIANRSVPLESVSPPRSCATDTLPSSDARTDRLASEGYSLIGRHGPVVGVLSSGSRQSSRRVTLTEPVHIAVASGLILSFHAST